MPQFHQIARRAFNRPLFLTPGAAETIGSYLIGRIAGDQQAAPHARRTPTASRFEGLSVGTRDGELYRRIGSAALITVEGELVNRGAWIGADSGLTSYEGISAQLIAAAQDTKVKSILLDIESPGGEAVGAMEMASVVRKVNAEKPVTAIANGLAASAAYALASGAGRIITIPSGMVGSIGVVALHVDQSAALEKKGVKPTLIFAGAHKIDGHPFAALPDDVRADLQAEIDGFYALFVQTVAAGRQGLTEAAIRGTEARTFIGADAVKVGLADVVGTLDEVLFELNRGKGHSNSSTGANMKSLPTEPTTILTAASTPPSIGPHSIEIAKAVADAKIRIGTIINSAEAKGREAQANHLAFNTEMSAEDARAILATATIGTPANTIQSAATDYEKRKIAAGAIIGFHEPMPDPKGNSAAGWTKAVKAANGRVGEQPSSRPSTSMNQGNLK